MDEIVVEILPAAEEGPPDKEPDVEVFIADSLQEAMKILKNHEIDHTVRYSSHLSTKDFGNTDINKERHKIYFNESSGIPFISLGQKRFDCHHGQRRRVKKKAKEEQVDQSNETPVKSRKRIASKKLGCPAKVIIKEMMRFPGYKVEMKSEYKKKVASHKLREAIKSCNVENQERFFELTIPSISTHRNHAIGIDDSSCQEIDHELSKKIADYVKSGVRNPDEMKQLLKMYVKYEIFPSKELPQGTNSRFYPSIKIIKCNMNRYLKIHRQAIIDQDCLLKKIEKWRESDTTVKIYFRPKSKDVETNKVKSVLSENNPGEGNDFDVVVENINSFIFVHQTKWQQDLMQQFGQEIIILEAVHKTTSYALPTFFLVIKTNLNYQIVATFIIDSETTIAIKEALTVIKSWNYVSPQYCLTDRCLEQIDALESTFQSTQVLICDYHRIQAWDSWFNRKTNGCFNHKAVILEYLNRIAESGTDYEMNQSLDLFKKSEFYSKNNYVNLLLYFNTYWFNMKERWILAYRQHRLRFQCSENYIAERKNDISKYSYLKKYNNSPLTNLLADIIEEFLPEKFKSYTNFNYISDGDSNIRGEQSCKTIEHNTSQKITEDCINDIFTSIDDETASTDVVISSINQSTDLAAECRDYLNAIHKLTFDVEQPSTVLEELKTTLQHAFKKVYAATQNGSEIELTLMTPGGSKKI